MNYLIITILVLASQISFAKSTINPPENLLEGTEMTFNVQHKDAIKQWAHNSKIKLKYLLDDSNDIVRKDEKVRYLLEGISSIVDDSFGQNYSTELFMRYILNRGRVLSQLLEDQLSQKDMNKVDLQLRVLMRSIYLAQDYYKIDEMIINRISGTGTVVITEDVPFSLFGVQYAQFLYDLNKSVLDISAQYSIAKTNLLWLAWDLAKDSNGAQYADTINVIIERVQDGNLPKDNKSYTDKEYLYAFKKLQRIYELVLSSLEKSGYEFSDKMTTQNYFERIRDRQKKLRLASLNKQREKEKNLNIKQLNSRSSHNLRGRMGKYSFNFDFRDLIDLETLCHDFYDNNLAGHHLSNFSFSLNYTKSESSEAPYPYVKTKYRACKKLTDYVKEQGLVYRKLDSSYELIGQINTEYFWFSVEDKIDLISQCETFYKNHISGHSVDFIALTVDFAYEKHKKYGYSDRLKTQFETCQELNNLYETMSVQGNYEGI